MAELTSSQRQNILNWLRQPLSTIKTGKSYNDGSTSSLTSWIRRIDEFDRNLKKVQVYVDSGQLEQSAIDNIVKDYEAAKAGPIPTGGMNLSTYSPGGYHEQALKDAGYSPEQIKPLNSDYQTMVDSVAQKAASGGKLNYAEGKTLDQIKDGRAVPTTSIEDLKTKFASSTPYTSQSATTSIPKQTNTTTMPTNTSAIGPSTGSPTPTNTSTASDNPYTEKAQRFPTYDKLKAYGYTDFKIAGMVDSSISNGLESNLLPLGSGSTGGTGQGNDPLSGQQQQQQAQGGEAMDYIKKYAGGMTGGTSGGTSGGTNTQGQDYNLQNALKVINESDLDEATKSYFREVVSTWDPNSEINIPNVLAKFQEIKDTTISPYFQEMSSIFTDDLQRSYGFMKGERDRQVESEEMSIDQQDRDVRSDLESRGMTFSGEAGRLLGTPGSAYNTGKQQSVYNAPSLTYKGAIPEQQFGEGIVPAQQRLMTTSSSERYKKNLEDLARKAETTLGSAGASGYGYGVPQIGGIKGDIERERTSAQGQTLSALYGQAVQNKDAAMPLHVFN